MRKKLALTLVYTTLATFCHLQLLHAACGTFEVSKGDVKVKSGKTGQEATANTGSKICSGDTVSSGADSRAKIKMEDGNELNISPNSQIVLEKYEFKPADNKKKVLLNILKGKVRAATKKENMYNDKAKDGQANTFQVRTKSAVAGVRGTDFLTGYNPTNNKSEVITFKGQVEVGQPGPGGRILNPVQVMAGQKTEAIPGRPPAAPRPVPKNELSRVNNETKAEAPKSSTNDGAAQRSTTEGGDNKDGQGAQEGQNGGSDSGQKNDGKGGDKSKTEQQPKSNDSKADDKKSETQPSGNREQPKSDSAGNNSNDGKKSDPTTSPQDKKRSPQSRPGNRQPTSVADKNTDKPKQPSSGSNANTGGDLPASDRAPTGPGAGSTTSAPPPTRPGNLMPLPPPGAPDGLPPMPPPIAGLPSVQIPILTPLPVIPKCDFCDTAVQNSPSRVNIRVQFQ